MQDAKLLGTPIHQASGTTLAKYQISSSIP